MTNYFLVIQGSEADLRAIDNFVFMRTSDSSARNVVFSNLFENSIQQTRLTLVV